MPHCSYRSERPALRQIYVASVDAFLVDYNYIMHSFCNKVV